MTSGPRKQHLAAAGAIRHIVILRTKWKMFDVFGNIFQVTPQQRSKYRKSAANMFTAVQMGTRTFSEQCSAVHYEVHCAVHYEVHCSEGRGHMNKIRARD